MYKGIHIARRATICKIATTQPQQHYVCLYAWISVRNSFYAVMQKYTMHIACLNVWRPDTKNVYTICICMFPTLGSPFPQLTSVPARIHTYRGNVANAGDCTYTGEQMCALRKCAWKMYAYIYVYACIYVWLCLKLRERTRSLSALNTTSATQRCLASQVVE